MRKNQGKNAQECVREKTPPLSGKNHASSFGGEVFLRVLECFEIQRIPCHAPSDT